MQTLTVLRISDAGLEFLASFEGVGGETLYKDAGRAELTVRLAVMVPLTQSQFDALVSFVLSVGAGNFCDSALLRKVNANDFAGATAEFTKWTRAGGKVVPGLVRRRAAEAALFATATAGF